MIETQVSVFTFSSVMTDLYVHLGLLCDFYFQKHNKFLFSIKMHQEKCNLNWQTYSDHLREMLNEMMKSNELTDVTLVCDDKIQFSNISKRNSTSRNGIHT